MKTVSKNEEALGGKRDGTNRDLDPATQGTAPLWLTSLPPPLPGDETSTPVLTSLEKELRDLLPSGGGLNSVGVLIS